MWDAQRMIFWPLHNTCDIVPCPNLLWKKHISKTLLPQIVQLASRVQSLYAAVTLQDCTVSPSMTNFEISPFLWFPGQFTCKWFDNLYTRYVQPRSTSIPVRHVHHTGWPQVTQSLMLTEWTKFVDECPAIQIVDYSKGLCVHRLSRTMENNPPGSVRHVSEQHGKVILPMSVPYTGVLDHEKLPLGFQVESSFFQELKNNSHVMIRAATNSTRQLFGPFVFDDVANQERYLDTLKNWFVSLLGEHGRKESYWLQLVPSHALDCHMGHRLHLIGRYEALT